MPRKYTEYRPGKYRHLKTSMPADDKEGEYVYEAVHMTAEHQDVAASAIVRRAVDYYIKHIYGTDNDMVLRRIEGKTGGNI